MIRNAKKQNDEDKNQMDERILDGNYLSEGPDFQCSERPFVQRFEIYN
jgi:hypothetical protein